MLCALFSPAANAPLYNDTSDHRSNTTRVSVPRRSVESALVVVSFEWGVRAVAIGRLSLVYACCARVDVHYFLRDFRYTYVRRAPTASQAGLKSPPRPRTRRPSIYKITYMYILCIENTKSRKRRSHRAVGAPPAGTSAGTQSPGRCVRACIPQDARVPLLCERVVCVLCSSYSWLCVVVSNCSSFEHHRATAQLCLSACVCVCVRARP